MPPEARAVVFDLDDTLYPYREYRLSGFRAVADHVAFTADVDARLVFATLLRASRGPDAGRELDACLSSWSLPASDLAALRRVLLEHRPTLQLPFASARVLTHLRAAGWRLGVLTNGASDVQQRKVEALGVADHVDAVVYATSHGSGIGKPEPAPFLEIARRLDVLPASTVFVGDDERCDIEGARAAGMHPVRCCAWVSGQPETRAAAVISRLSRVPDVARAILQEAGARHAA